MINFSLQAIDKVSLFYSSGDNPTYSAHWFALTDGQYWLSLGDTKIYEYTAEILKQWNSDTWFVDYYIVRLLEDFTDLFADIAEEVPADLYEYVSTPGKLSLFLEKTKQWYQQHENDGPENASWNTYYEMEAWLHHRTLYAGHLQHSPAISFLRVNDEIHIIWRADDVTEDNIPVWTAGNGSITMKYSRFVEHIEDFAQRFFPAMDKQIQQAIDKEWDANVNIDKPRLLTEQQERRNEFQQKVSLLKNPANETNWPEIKSLVTPFM